MHGPVMFDTLRAARSLETRGFTREQDEAIAETIGETGISALKRELDVQRWMIGIVVLIVAAALWQIFTLRGELAGVRETVGRLDARAAAVEQRLTTVEQRLTATEARLGNIETKLEAILNRLPLRP